MLLLERSDQASLCFCLNKAEWNGSWMCHCQASSINMELKSHFK